MERILVTGAAGFLGANFVRALLHRGEEVHALVRPDGDLWRLEEIRESIGIHAVDLADVEPVIDLVTRLRPQRIFNLAAKGGHQTTRDDRLRAVACNVLGTWNLLEAARQVDCLRFVQVGSSTEYGPHAYPLEESLRDQPTTFRGATKAAATLACLQAAREGSVPTVILRSFSVYGAWEGAHRFVATTIRAALGGGEMRLTKSGFRRDFVHIDDVVRASLLAARAEGVVGEIINIGTGIQTSNEDLVHAVESVTGATIRVQPGTYPSSPSDTGHWCADIEKAGRLLAWRPQNSLEEGLRLSVEWFRRRGEPAGRTGDVRGDGGS
ncbi:MAG: NAD-dependent epimerase/dehydratase family protein [Candidatus Binatia bacterium]|nr:NAD-dependent epimerase/dehydratase family protein [Candidatus Binatia bacterium]